MRIFSQECPNEYVHLSALTGSLPKIYSHTQPPKGVVAHANQTPGRPSGVARQDHETMVRALLRLRSRSKRQGSWPPCGNRARRKVAKWPDHAQVRGQAEAAKVHRGLGRH